jgi:GTP-binding protein
VGKSSLINLLTGNKSLAKTSGTPGKTRTINHFIVNESWYIADLPGYGFAKYSKEGRKQWDAFVRDYLLERRNLLTTFLLVDARHDLLPADDHFINWMGENELPFCLVFTKSDKMTASRLHARVTSYGNRLLETWESLPPVFVTSARTGAGKDEMLSFISHTNTIFHSESPMHGP